MNRNELRKLIGKTVKFYPIPRQDSESGSYQSDKNLWLVRCETPDRKGFEFFNMHGNYNSLVLDSPKINKFDEPDVLIIRGKVVFDGSTVRYEPFTPQPDSVSAANTNLSMFLEGADETGLLEITSPTFEALRFSVKNTGEQTARDYRNTILIPQAFRHPSSQSYLGDLSKQGETTSGEKQYIVYEKFVNNPIYKNESVKIGQLILQADPGEYTLLWQIRCDDGSFPTETTYGEMKIRVAPLSSLVKHAVENLYKEP